MKIVDAGIFFAEIPLTTPYELSFVTVRKVESIVVRIELENGEIGYGEAVPLTGYSSETKDGLLKDISSVLPELIGLDSKMIETFLLKRLPHSAFAVSALLVAKEMALGEITWPDSLEVPLLAPVSVTPKVETAINKAMDFYLEGFKTIKLKVGRNITNDCATVKFLLDELPDDTYLRVDVNQAYKETEANQLLTEILNHPRWHLLELVEQPFGIDEWLLFERLVERFPDIPLMLDESILDDDDVYRAAGVGAKFVKLKLYKHKGMHGLIELARQAKDLDMQVVLGNGVSTDIGNLFEAVAFSEKGLFSGASEGNGFVKLKQNSLINPLTVEKGMLCWKNDLSSHPCKVNHKIYKQIM